MASEVTVNPKEAMESVTATPVATETATVMPEVATAAVTAASVAAAALVVTSVTVTAGAAHNDGLYTYGSIDKIANHTANCHVKELSVFFTFQHMEL